MEIKRKKMRGALHIAILAYLSLSPEGPPADTLKVFTKTNKPDRRQQK